MKLKIVALSMAIAGFISLTAHADNNSTNTSTPSTAQQPVEKSEIKNLRDIPSQPAPVVTVPRVDIYQPILDGMTQNLGRKVHSSPDWFQRIGVMGGVNVDGHWGNLDMGYNGENSRKVSVNDVYLNFTALVNDWTKAFASISFNNTTGPNTNFSEVANSDKGGQYSSVYANNELYLEQGYITIGNFDCSPFFIQLGKQFTDFGRYQIHPIERTMAQVLSESLQTSAKIGFVTNVGFHGSIYAFDDMLRKEGNAVTSAVYGGSIGFEQQPCDQLGFDIGAGFISSMTGINDVANSIRIFEARNVGTADPVGTFESTVGAWNVYGDINSGPFTVGARYTSAAKTFNATTLSSQANTVFATGARPWAGDITAGYAFNALTKNQNVYIGYQASGNAVNLLIPRSRWIAGYGIDVMKYTTLSAEYGHDQDYSSGNGGTGDSSNTIGARAAVKFG